MNVKYSNIDWTAIKEGRHPGMMMFYGDDIDWQIGDWYIGVILAEYGSKHYMHPDLVTAAECNGVEVMEVPDFMIAVVTLVDKFKLTNFSWEYNGHEDDPMVKTVTMDTTVGDVDDDDVDILLDAAEYYGGQSQIFVVGLSPGVFILRVVGPSLGLPPLLLGETKYG